MSAWGFWTQPGARAYTACGSFVRWLVDTRGMERFRVLWRRGDFDRAYGEPLSALVAAWRGEIARIQPTALELRRAARLFGGGSIFQEVCAHEVAALERDAATRSAAGDAAGADSVWARVLEIDPGKPSHRLERARARLRGGDAAGALSLARGVVAEAPPRVLDRALRLAGDAAWAAGDFAAADSFYAAGQAAASGSADARAFEVVRAVLADGRLAPILAPALADAGAGEAAVAGVLARAREVAPDSPLPRYLLGRRLYYAGEFAAASSELEAAVAGGGLGPHAGLAAHELAARAELAAGSADGAAAAFQSMAATPELPAWRRLELEDRAFRAARVAGARRSDPRQD
jgi:hypothetical protein